jgi:phosphatidate cytidylyltransferase
MPGYTVDTAADRTHGVNTSDPSLRTRLISAIFIGVFTIGCGLLGGPWFSGFVLLAVVIAAYEMIMMMRASGFQPSLAFGIASTVISFAGVLFTPAPVFFPLLSVLLLGSLAWQMRHREGKPIADWAIAIAGGAYLGWTGGHIAAVRQLNAGLWWLIITIGITWIADSGAYVAGRRFGKHKLAPHLSPHKTWEGYFGGLIAALAGGLIIGIVSPLGVWPSIAAAFLVGALGTLGDLAESMFKRQADMKDSGHLIPGHGGVFDRIDSLLWAGVVVFYYVTIFYHQP